MKIRAGYEIAFEMPQPTPLLFMLSIHPSRMHDLVTPQRIVTAPDVVTRDYRDMFGNVCTRALAPAGLFTLRTDFIINDSGEPDPVVPEAKALVVDDLPDDVVVFLLGSRYCDTDKLMNEAWALFGQSPEGWGRVQAICDHVHSHLKFGYEHASATRSAYEGFNERLGVCRDFAHLAITFCRCMNIPARYCTGYLGDIGVPLDPAPMDFSAWFEAYLDGEWYTFDARHNVPRIGRILMARGRDATDVALSTIFGTNTLAKFEVVTDEIAG
jgi:transglutaminase-like putative cysteine protease